MRIKNSLFPYPVLNSKSQISSYNGVSFSFDYDEAQDKEFYYLKNICIKLDDDDINKLEKDLKKYFIDLHHKGNMVDVEELVGIIQDLLVELEEQKEKYDDMVDYYTNNEPDYEVY